MSVESDPAWVDAVSQHPEIAPLILSGNTAILYGNIGPTKSFGAPASMDHVHKWPTYIRLPWVEWARRGTMPELVLVDGRFRVAACLSTIVTWTLAGGEGRGPIVVLHDVVPERTSYTRIFDFFEIIESVETLRVLRIRPFSSPLKAFGSLLESFFDPA